MSTPVLLNFETGISIRVVFVCKLSILIIYRQTTRGMYQGIYIIYTDRSTWYIYWCSSTSWFPDRLTQDLRTRYVVCVCVCSSHTAVISVLLLSCIEK